MRLWPATLVLAVLWASTGIAAAQTHRREPLTQPEIDQLRDAAMDPNTRLKLFINFARARLSGVEQQRKDPKAVDRGEQIHDRLQEFSDIYDELNENIDNFLGRKEDLRRPLKLVIEADNEFQATLLALKEAGDVPPDEAEKYRFVLDSTLDTVSASVGDHKQLLAEQEEAAKHRKK